IDRLYRGRSRPRLADRPLEREPAKAPRRALDRCGHTDKPLPSLGAIRRRHSPHQRPSGAPRPRTPRALPTCRPVTPIPRSRPIGVFDSGVGGLTVLHELLVALPHEDFVYLGDTARFPYGGRTPEELERFSLEVAEGLIERRVKLLVVACNSATAAALPAVQRRMMETTLGVDVLGVVK